MKKSKKLNIDSIQEKDISEIDDLLKRKFGKELEDSPSVFRIKKKPKLKNKERKKEDWHKQVVRSLEKSQRNAELMSWRKKKLAQAKKTRRRGVRRVKEAYGRYIRKGI